MPRQTYRANRELGLGAAKPFQLRMPTEIWKRVEKEATKNGRSLNAEVLRMIETALSLSSSRAAEPAAEGYLPEPDRLLLQLYRAMPPESQLALITLLRGSPPKKR